MEVMFVLKVVSWGLGFGRVGFEGLPLSCGMRGIHVLSEGSSSQTADLPPAPMPAKEEAKREANKCSGYARINKTFSRSVVIRYPGDTPQSQFSKTGAHPGRRLRIPGLVNTPKSKFRKQVHTWDKDSRFLG